MLDIYKKLKKGDWMEIKGEIIAYCYMVDRGKPAACIALQERFIEDNLNFIKSNKLKSYIEPLSEGWVTLWIYKYSHILDVIKSLPQYPTSTFNHWVLGKLFGYDENSISNYLRGKIT